MIKLTDTLQETAKLAEIARQCKITRSAVSQWDQVPAKHVLRVESVTGISRHDLRPDIYGPSDSSLDVDAATSSPVDSSSGKAGALPTTPHDAPAIFQQDRAEVAQLVHTQQVAGSNPAPATSYPSPDCLPSGDDAGAQHSLAGCAPAEISEGLR
jgi:Putative antitoxin of bacterial toxin-antitoxin system, YdaS/YdaT